MTVERGLRLMAGVMVLLSLGLAHFFSTTGFCLLHLLDLIFCSLHSPTGALP